MWIIRFSTTHTYYSNDEQITLKIRSYIESLIQVHNASNAQIRNSLDRHKFVVPKYLGTHDRNCGTLLVLVHP